MNNFLDLNSHKSLPVFSSNTDTTDKAITQINNESFNKFKKNILNGSMTMKKFYILVCLLAFSLPTILNAGIYGYLEGKVVDEEGKPLPGATITIPSIKKQAMTKEGGKFRIAGLVA